MATLTLSTTGPSPDSVTIPKGNRALTITNELGATVTLTLTPSGFLNPSSGSTLDVPTTGWSGTVGASGTYSYSEPGSEKRAPRNGTINVG